jgi:cystathionine beta-lyase
MEVQDVPDITAVCRPRGVITLLDNTWATPVFFQPLRLGVDVVIHAATKYIIGHADSFLGVIVCTAETFPAVRRQSILLGQCAGPDDLHLALRGLRTLSVRLRHHQQQALALAQWLQQRPQIAQVLYPALPDDPGHALWRRDFSGASGLMSVVLRGGLDPAAVDAMINGLQLFGLGHSWGGFESLIVPVDLAASRRSFLPVYPGPMLRIHVGLEDLDDLKADLSAGLSHID